MKRREARFFLDFSLTPSYKELSLSIKGMIMVRLIGARIRKWREESGVTQEELAEAVGLSSEFISYLELGKRTPSLATLARIAAHLKKDTSAFLTEKEDPFRALGRRKDLHPRLRRALRRFRSYCLRYLELEKLTGRHSSLAPLYADAGPELMAEQERRRLGLGGAPIRDIFTLVEQNGLCLWRYPLPAEAAVSGVFVFLEEKLAAFALIDSNQPLPEQVMSAGHLYAHYLKHRHDGPVVDNPDVLIEDYVDLYPGREKFAQLFASNFLLPPSRVLEIVNQEIRSKHLHPEDIGYIAEYFGVGPTGVLQALRRMELVSPGQFKKIQKGFESLAESGWISAEIRKRSLRRGPLLSPRFKSLVLDAYRKRKIGPQEAAKLMRVKEEVFSSFSGR